MITDKDIIDALTTLERTDPKDVYAFRKGIHAATHEKKKPSIGFRVVDGQLKVERWVYPQSTCAVVESLYVTKELRGRVLKMLNR